MRDETDSEPYKNELYLTRTWELITMLCVKSCSKTLEKLCEIAAGPVCLTFGCILISIGTVCFCECIWRSSECVFTHDVIVDVIAPTLSYPIISIPICVLVALNVCMHYFYAITISPGFLDDPARDSGKSFLWARKTNVDTKGKKMIRGASWSEKGVKITPASTAKCLKCEKLRPEVSLIIFFNESCQIKVTVNLENSPLFHMQ